MNLEEKTLRNDAIQQSTKFAITTPYKVMQTAYGSMQVMKAMAEFGKSDVVYHLMQDYEVVIAIHVHSKSYLINLKVVENETWMVRPGFVHAPGPAVTIEIQFAQVSIPDKYFTKKIYGSINGWQI